MDKKAVNDFLLYNLLGITLDDEEKKCVFACIMKAYSDATNQGAYNTQIKGLSEKSDTAKKEAASYLYEECRDFFTRQNSQKADFNEWHNKLCCALVEKYNKNNVKDSKGKMIFTYGNAQKWVNMTVKYLNLLVSMDILKSYKNEMDNNKREYHIPIDSYILSVLWRDSDKEVKEKFPSENTCNHNFCKVITWSNWDNYNTYFEFKNNVIDKFKRKDLDPLDYENELWISEVKLRKSNETEDRIRSFFRDELMDD